MYNIHTPVSGRAKAHHLHLHHEHQGHHEGQEGQELNIYTTTTATTNPITSTTKGKSYTPTPTLLALHQGGQELNIYTTAEACRWSNTVDGIEKDIYFMKE
jgi:hypothetical protein